MCIFFFITLVISMGMVVSFSISISIRFLCFYSCFLTLNLRGLKAPKFITSFIFCLCYCSKLIILFVFISNLDFLSLACLLLFCSLLSISGVEVFLCRFLSSSIIFHCFSLLFIIKNNNCYKSMPEFLVLLCFFVIIFACVILICCIVRGFYYQVYCTF